MIEPGAKGSYLNAQHVLGAIGSIEVNGRPIPRLIDHRRTLPHFDLDHTDPRCVGFTDTNYARGLSPHQYFFGCMAGREGLIDTAVKTANTGYIQRRMVKAMEELHVEYDSTVRNAEGWIVQFQYGDDGLSGQFLERHVPPFSNSLVNANGSTYLNATRVSASCTLESIFRIVKTIGSVYRFISNVLHNK